MTPFAITLTREFNRFRFAGARFIALAFQLSEIVHMTYPKLYKYVPSSRFDVLETGWFRFTQPAAMNDPFDVSPFISLGSDDYIREKVTQKVLQEFKPEGKPWLDKIRHTPNYERFKQSAEEGIRDQIEFEIKAWKQILKEEQEHLKRTVSAQIGLFCMTENPDSILMWSHYADSHQGFVLEFDTSHEFFSEKGAGNFLRPVQYSHVRPGFLPDADLEIDPMFVKSFEWEYEKEWRLIKRLDLADKHIKAQPFDIFLFKIPWKAIKTVILGCNMSERSRNRILNMVKKNESRTLRNRILHLVKQRRDLQHLKILIATPHPDEFRLSLRSIDDADIFENFDFHFM